MLDGKYFKNGKKTLVLVFQNAAKGLNDSIEGVFNGTISQNEIAQLHDHFNWIKMQDKEPTADYFFIKDHFSSIYGWYCINSGKLICDEFNNELTSFIKKGQYNKVIAFGSSKGGTGALLYGLMNPCISDVFSVVPQIHVSDYINKLCPNEKSLFFAENNDFEEQVNNLFYSDFLYDEERKKDKPNILLYTGVNDIQFKDLIDIREFLITKGVYPKLFLNRSDERHTQIINQKVSFIYSVLKDLIENEESNVKKTTVSIGQGNYLVL